MINSFIMYVTSFTDEMIDGQPESFLPNVLQRYDCASREINATQNSTKITVVSYVYLKTFLVFKLFKIFI